MGKASGFSVIGIRLCLRRDLIPKKWRKRSVWDEEKITKKIRAMHKKHLPLYAAYVMDNHGKLFSAALRQFGSWANALVATGVTKKPRTKKLYKGRASLLNALSDALERHTVKNVPQALKLEAAHYFGSLEKAIAALKKQGKQLPGWNRRKIITVLSRMHRSKERLAYARARREVPALVAPPKPILAVGVRLCMPQGSTQICILCITSGANEESVTLSEKLPEANDSCAHVHRGRHGQGPHCQ